MVHPSRPIRLIDAGSYRLPYVPKGAWLERRYIRCGKRCRCRRGQLHGGYWRLCWREEGRRLQRYLRRDELPTYREAVDQRRHQLAERRAQLLMADASLKQAKLLLRCLP